MSSEAFCPIRTARVAWEGAIPVAPDFGDAYFSRSGGPAESKQVFLDGNELARRFARLSAGEVFVIGETGFGTGLNCLLAAELFEREARAGSRLVLISAEQYPLARSELQRALGHWPALGGLAEALVEEYPPPVAGFHRLRLTASTELVLMLGEAAAMWQHCDARVDAWFLDGFAPRCNPEMWRPALFAEIARCSRPGASLATYTVAGPARRGLAEAGFVLQRRSGFATKRHRLTGVMPGRWRPQTLCSGHAVVAGAGLAGTTTARALAERGWRVTLIDPAGIAQGASGNRTGVVYTSPGGRLTAQNRFYQSGYLRALRWLARHRFPETERDGHLNGVIQHLVDERLRKRARDALATGAWPPDLLAEAGPTAVELKGGGYLCPARWCERLADHAAIEFRRQAVTGLAAGPVTEVRLADGGRLDADAVVLCMAEAVRKLPGFQWLPLKRIRGQVSYCRATEESRKWRQVECHKGYLTPALEGLHCVGATFNLHETSPMPRVQDDRANLEALRQHLPSRWRELGGNRIEVVERRVAFRCHSRDFLPLCGPAAGGTRPGAKGRLVLNIAHGSRGICGTPLCAELVADQLGGLPLSVDRGLALALAPSRFVGLGPG